MPNVVRRVCAVLLLLPGIAAAHPGHEFAVSAFDGFLHPFTGLDHVLAMVATGLWASHLGKRATFVLPIVFAFAMLCGSALALFGIDLPAFEPMIALSVVVLGVAVTARVRVSELFGAALVATFAIFHGYAHATEATALQLSFAAGFSIATMTLSSAGVAIGTRLVLRESRVARVAGSLISVSGAILLLGA